MEGCDEWCGRKNIDRIDFFLTPFGKADYSLHYTGM